MDDLTTLTDDGARDLLAQVYADVQRRDAIANAPAQAEQIRRAWADASGRKDGDPWTQPTGDYHLCAEFTFWNRFAGRNCKDR